MIRMRCLLLALAALTLAAGEAQLGPGHHRRLPCPGTAYTIDILVPASYAVDGTARLPALWLSSPVGNPGTDDLQDWAQREGVALVSFNDSKNGLQMDEVVRIQEAGLATARGLVRLHPHLNLAEGTSGGANCSVALTERRPLEFCGVLLQCMSGSTSAQHHALAWIHGAKDPTIGVEGVWASYEAARQARRPVWIEVNRGRKHTPGSKDEKEAAVDLILWAGRLTHPKLARDELAAHGRLLVAAIDAAIALAEPAARRRRCEFLLGLLGADKAPNAAAAVKAWGEARLAEIDAEAAPGRQLWLLGGFGRDALAKRLPPEVRAAAKTRLDALRKDPAAVKGAAAEEEWQTLFEEEKRVGLDRGRLEALRQKFAAFAAKHPGHPKAAAGDADRLAKVIAGL